MDIVIIKNNITRTKALIEQYKASELYTEIDKRRRIESLEKDIDKYSNMLDEVSKDVEVNNPEIM